MRYKPGILLGFVAYIKAALALCGLYDIRRRQPSIPTTRARI